MWILKCVAFFCDLISNLISIKDIYMESINTEIQALLGALLCD